MTRMKCYAGWNRELLGQGKCCRRRGRNRVEEINLPLSAFPCLWDPAFRDRGRGVCLTNSTSTSSSIFPGRLPREGPAKEKATLNQAIEYFRHLNTLRVIYFQPPLGAICSAQHIHSTCTGCERTRSRTGADVRGIGSALHARCAENSGASSVSAPSAPEDFVYAGPRSDPSSRPRPWGISHLPNQSTYQAAR